MNLKDYQKKAVEDTLRHANSILRTDYPGIKNIIIDAIMGSGKTVIAARVIDDLIDTEDIYPVFIWLTPGKGNLEEQSKNKISELSVNSKCLLADELHGLDRLDPGTVVFINWEKFGKGKKINRGGDYASIDDIMNNTRQRCTVVLFVDESHVVSDSEKSIHIKQEDI